jgi:uncharacterized radical SAM protein YgiQ
MTVAPASTGNYSDHVLEKQTMKFLPTTPDELKQLGWDRLDIILVTGDAYIDSPFIGVAMIGRVLAEAGFRVGIIAQPDINSEKDITRLGEPRLFWGVSGGSIDSMVANYTATKRKRRSDDYTPGGKNERRPDRALIVYSNLIRRYFKQTRPLVLGGVEASMRRIAHYDYWSDSVRKSVLFDAKADFLIYGMGERAVVELAKALDRQDDPKSVRGLCYVATQPPTDCEELPSYDQVATDKPAFIEMFKRFYANNDPITASTLCQKQDTRYLVQNQPALPLSTKELDAAHELAFTGDVHPYYAKQGEVKALETIRFALMTHRGCYGECNFCSITVHQGRTVQWRSEESIVNEARRLASRPDFKGYVNDVGGPTANMYGFECDKKLTEGACLHKRCIYPRVCKELKVDHSRQTRLLTRLRKIPGIKKVFVASGVRQDLVLADQGHGLEYMKELVGHHVSGQMKIAPEHTEDSVLKKMGKPSQESLSGFVDLFYDLTQKANKQQFLTYYLIAAHPGCTLDDMQALKRYTGGKLRISPEQVQIFTPLPSTYSALMYYTGIDPFSGKRLFVEKDIARKEEQKNIVTEKPARPKPKRPVPADRRPVKPKPPAKPARPGIKPRRGGKK